MDRVQAWEQFNDPNYCGNLTMGQFKELLLKVGYKEEVAHKAAMQRGWDRLCAGVEM
jgi:hypothetical protein